MDNLHEELLTIVNSVKSDLILLVDNLHNEEGEEKVIIDGVSCDLYSYFDQALDIEYRVGPDLTYRAVRIAIALGGPNIYVDTNNTSVEGCWGSAALAISLPTEVCEEIDKYFEMEFNYTYQ